MGRPSLVPGEDAARIGEHEALGAEVAADGKEAVVRHLRRGNSSRSSSLKTGITLPA
jgi:hypothetical protein